MKKPLFRSVLALLLASTTLGSIAQTATASAACRLLGTDTVGAGSVASFTLGPCTASNWTVSCGNIVAQAPGSVTIDFAGTCGSAVITATTGAATGPSKTVTIVSASVFAAGTAQVAAQTISYNRIPATLTVAPATLYVCFYY